jgi:hypothetical protein
LTGNYTVAAPQGDQGSVGGQELTADPRGGGVLVTDYNSAPDAQTKYVLEDIVPGGQARVLFDYPGGVLSYPRSLAVSPGGASVYAGLENEGTDVPDKGALLGYDRGGNPSAGVFAPYPDQDPPTDTPVAASFASAGCLSKSLFYGVDDHSAEPASSADLFAKSIDDPSMDPGEPLAAPPTSDTGPAGVSVFLAQTPAGRLVFAEWDTVVVISCLGGRPLSVPTNSTATGAGGPAPNAPNSAPSQPGTSPGGSYLRLPGGSAGQPAAQMSPVQAPSPQPGLHAGSQGAAQASLSPNIVGVADTPNDQPAMALPATLLGSAVAVWLGAAGMTFAAGIGAAWVLGEANRRREMSPATRRRV